MNHPVGPPPAQGLYDPQHEHDACGVGFVVHVKGRKSHDIVVKALTVLKNLLHRGACGCEPNTGDGAGILMQMPDRFFRQECTRLGIARPEYLSPRAFEPSMPVLPSTDKPPLSEPARARLNLGTISLSRLEGRE